PAPRTAGHCLGIASRPRRSGKQRLLEAHLLLVGRTRLEVRGPRIQGVNGLEHLLFQQVELPFEPGRLLEDREYRFIDRRQAEGAGRWFALVVRQRELQPRLSARSVFGLIECGLDLELSGPANVEGSRLADRQRYLADAVRAQLHRAEQLGRQIELEL